MLSPMIALTLACALSSAVNAGDGGNSPKSGADSPDSAGLEESYLEIEKTKLHIVQGGTGQQTVVMIHGNAGDVHDFEYGVAELLSKSYRVIDTLVRNQIEPEWLREWVTAPRLISSDFHPPFGLLGQTLDHRS
jgi:hypothetical protein